MNVSGNPIDARTRKQIVADFIQDAWNDGDAAAVDRDVAARYTIRHDPGDPWDGRTLDRRAFKKRLKESRAPFPDQLFEIRELFADGDAVVATWLWSGTHAGDLPGFPATGRFVRMSGATVYDFEGGRLRGHWQIKDTLSLLARLQGSEPPPTPRPPSTRTAAGSRPANSG